MRRVIYQEIAEQLRIGIEAGDYARGELLPSESELGGTFSASRVTVRKALELLRNEGLIESRQGLGWIVAGQLVTQSTDALVSIERQLNKLGRDMQRKVTDFRFCDAPRRVARHLGPKVLEVGRLNWVEGQPFSRIVVWCREDLALDLSQAQVASASFLDLLSEKAARAVQTIGAHGMGATEAELLQVEEGSPALVVRRTTYGGDSRALFMSEHCFPGHLTEFVAELSAGDAPENELRLMGQRQ